MGQALRPDDLAKAVRTLRGSTSQTSQLILVANTAGASHAGDQPAGSHDPSLPPGGGDFRAIEPEHAAAIESLPMHHQDHFDRILVAQAQTEPMRLLTHDPLLARYGDCVVPL